MNAHFPASQKSNYSSLQADKLIYLSALSLQRRHTHVHRSTWWMMMNPWSPSIFLSQSKGSDICTKHKRDDKQASVIFNKRSSLKGSKQNLPSVYATHKRNKFKCWAFEGKQKEKKQSLSIKKTRPNQQKTQPLLDRVFLEREIGKNRWRKSLCCILHKQS